MSEDMKKEVEKLVQPTDATAEVVASTEPGVETSQSPAPEIDPEVDYEAQNSALIEELARVEKEKENYKRAALKAKGKLPQPSSYEEEEEPSDLEALIEKKVEEKLILSRETQIRRQQEELIKKALKENKELKLALQAKSQISNTSIGASGSSSSPAPSDGVLTKEQIQLFKQQGWDDTKIQRLKDNLLKTKK